MLILLMDQALISAFGKKRKKKKSLEYQCQKIENERMRKTGLIHCVWDNDAAQYSS